MTLRRRARLTRRSVAAAAAALSLFGLVAQAWAAAPPAREIVQKVLESDPWGLGGAEVSARATLTDKRGSQRELVFSARSFRYSGTLAKSVVYFSAPADLAGAGFLQIQKSDGEDERYLYLPELKKSRRISGNLRANSFMGTDFSFADLDRRDLRDSVATALTDEAIGKFDCYHVEAAPARSDAQYKRMELWVRKDNFLPLRMRLFDHSGVLAKTFTAVEVQRISGEWFITRSKMRNEQQDHSTELVLEKITPSPKIADDEFSVRALEKR